MLSCSSNAQCQYTIAALELSLTDLSKPDLSIWFRVQVPHALSTVVPGSSHAGT